MNDANPKMSDANKCPQCGTPLKNPALGGLCPACLLKEGAAGDTVAGGRFPFFEPPSVAELVAKFPQLEILELIGKGGMGAVYKARQKELDRVVALKILPPGIGDEAGFAERFSREAKALAKLNHPGIVTIHDFGRTDGLFYFVMEFVDGVNLRQLLQGSRISPHEALAIVPQICDALQFAHDHGIVHRDIKPENILMDRRGRVKVADFGLAKLVGTDSSFGVPPSGGSDRVNAELQTSAFTDAGKVMGTPNYMAPEQTENPSQVDHRADIYALGVVFYQMLTGELPGKQLQPPSSKVQIDVRLDEIVLRALEKKPELRYQQASVLKSEVETIADSGSAGVPPAEPGVAPGSRADKEIKRGGFVIVGRENGKRVIVWRGVTTMFMAVFGCSLLGALLARLFLPVSAETLLFVSVFGAIMVTVGGILTGWRTPIEELANLDDANGIPPSGATPDGTRGTRALPETPPRFSRTAIAGACWIALFLLGSVLWYSNGTGAFVTHRQEPDWSQIIPVTLLAALGTTILGWIAVSQIRRSAGKLYGLGLATFDGLFFPLATLTGLIGWFWWWIFMEVLYPSELRQNLGPIGRVLGLSPLQIFEANHVNALTVLSTIASTGFLSVFIIRRVWRAVKKPFDGAHSAAPARPPRPTGVAWKIAALIFALGITTAVINYKAKESWQIARGRVQAELRDEIARRLADRRIIYSYINFDFIENPPHAVFRFGGLQGWAGVTNGVPRALRGKLLVRFDSSNICILSGTGDLADINDVFPITRGLWWPKDHAADRSIGKGEPQAPQLVTFGPVIVRTLSFNESLQDAFLDLDTGRLLTPPKDIAALFKTAYGTRVSWEQKSDPRAVKIREWLRASGANLMAWGGEFGERLEMREGVAIQPPWTVLNGVGGRVGFDQTDPNVVAKQAEVFLKPLQTNSVIKIPLLQPGYDPQLGLRQDTFLFMTREGTVGVLQILNTEDNPRGLKIRYKLVKNNLAAPAANISSSQIGSIANPISFGPVIEREINSSDGGTNNYFLDLDTDKFFEASDYIHGLVAMRFVGVSKPADIDEQIERWARSVGADLMVPSLDHGEPMIVYGGLTSMSGLVPFEKLTPGDVLRQTRETAEAQKLSGKPKPPYSGCTVCDGTLLIFETREGGIGVIESLGRTNSFAIKVRYKMVQNYATLPGNTGASNDK